MSTADESTRIDFFISYTSSDRQWAEWIAWQLEEAGYATIIQAWDIRPGHNFVEAMHQATRRSAKTLAVLSRAYVEGSTFTQPEWQSRVREDPAGADRALLPVRVGECEPGGLLAPIVYVDLVGVDEDEARVRLLDAAQDKRARPVVAPVFPGAAPVASVTSKPVFPPSPAPPQGPRESGRAPADGSGPGDQLRRGAGQALGALQALRRLPRSPKTALAGAVLLVLAVVVAIIVWPDDHAAGTPTFTQVGVSPRSLALGVGADRLWVADQTQPEAWWLDASGDRVRTHRVPLNETARPTGVAVDATRETAWVVDEGNDLAWQIDIRSKTFVRKVKVGDSPQAVAVAEGVVWVANSRGTVDMINAISGQRIGKPIAIGERLSGIAAGGGAVWVLDGKDGIVWRIDASSGKPAPPSQVENARSIAIGDGVAWVARSDGTVSRIAPDGVTSIDVGDQLCGIAVGQGGVWVSAPGKDRVWRIDPATRERSGPPIQVEDAPCAIAAGAGSVWVANRGDSSISRIRP
jgi:DNA-binding beta-propeller fold protein YncE